MHSTPKLDFRTAFATSGSSCQLCKVHTISIQRGLISFRAGPTTALIKLVAGSRSPERPTLVEQRDIVRSVRLLLG